MIIDVHYHLMPRLPKAMAEQMALHSAHGAERFGLKIDAEDVVRRAVETWADPTGERMVEAMEASGVDLILACMMDDARNPRLTAERMQEGNRLAGEIARRFSGRVLALAGVDPRRPEAPDMMKQCFEEFGLLGVKYHPDNGYDPAGPESYKVLEVVAEHNGILLTHTGPLSPPSRAHFAHPMRLADLAVDFPSVRVIAAHMGFVNWRPWASLAMAQESLYGDLAMWAFLAAGRYERFCHELRAILDLAGVSRVLFGTDDPLYNTVLPTREWIRLLKDLPANAPNGVTFTHEEIEAILGGNAAALLGLADQA